MFACLQLTQKESHPLRDWRRPPQPQLVRVDCPGGGPFFRLEAPCRKGGGPDWALVEQAAGRLRTKMLFPEGVVPPAPPEPATPARAQMEPGLRAYVPKRLPLLLSLRCAQQVLRATAAPAQSLRVTVVDSKGVLCRSLEAIVPLAGSLRVFSTDLSAWRGVAAGLLARYGVTLILSDSVGCFAQSDVVIASDLSLFTGRERGLIFTPDRTPLPGCRVVRCNDPVLPESCAGLAPEGIDTLLFASALYELCGVKEMERLQFGGFGFDGVSQRYTLEDLAAILENSCAAALDGNIR